MSVQSLALKGLAGVVGVSSVSLGSLYLYGNRDTDTSIKLTKEEKEFADETTSWTLTENESSLNFAKQEGKVEACQINVTGTNPTVATIKTNITNKFGSANPTEDNKKYRRAFLKKCKNNNGNLTLSADNSNADLSKLFDFSEETLNDSETSLANKDWTFSDLTLDSSKLKMEITIAAGNENNSSVNTCKIIGTKSDNTALTNTIFNSSKTKIKESIEAWIKDKNTTEKYRKNFLIKCKRSYGNEIKLEVKEHGGKYELKDLNNLFKKNLFYFF